MVLTKQQLVIRLSGIGSDLSSNKMTIAAAEVEFVDSLKNTPYVYFSKSFEGATKSVTSLVRFIYSVILVIDGMTIGNKIKSSGKYMFECETPVIERRTKLLQ